MTMISPDTVHMVLGIAGNVIALVRYLAPVPTFYRIWKNGSVEQYSAAPYDATLRNCMLWLLYGLPAVQPHRISMPIIIISTTGMVTQLAYIALFLAFSVGNARRRNILLLVAIVAFVGVLAGLVLSLAQTHEIRAMIIGIIIVLFGTGMYASPLTVMKMVIQTKSVEYMPLFLSITLLLNSVCWTAYAIVRFDLYLTITNGLGVIFSVAQLILYAIYYKSTQQIMEARKADRVVIITEAVVDNSDKSNPSSGTGTGTRTAAVSH